MSTTVTSSESSSFDLETISNLELLSEVKKAIRAILIGGQSYKIGSRSLTRADLNALRDLKKELEEAKEKISQIKELQSKTHIKNYMIWHTFHNNFKRQSRPFSTSNEKDFQMNDKIFYSRLRNKNAIIYQNKDKNNERILSLYADYTSYNPYVTMMMTNGASVTEYNHKKYIQTNATIPPSIDKNSKTIEIKKRKKIKKYFGIDGDTPLERNLRGIKKVGRKTLTDLYSTTSLGMKTMTNFPTKFSNKNIFNKKKSNNNSDLNNFYTLNNISESDRKTARNLFLDSFRTKNRKVASKENK